MALVLSESEMAILDLNQGQEDLDLMVRLYNGP